MTTPDSIESTVIVVVRWVKLGQDKQPTDYTATALNELLVAK